MSLCWSLLRTQRICRGSSPPAIGRQLRHERSGGDSIIGVKKLSTIREELRAAFAEQGANPIAASGGKLRNLKKSQAARKRRVRSFSWATPLLRWLKTNLRPVASPKTKKKAV